MGILSPRGVGEVSSYPSKEILPSENLYCIFFIFKPEILPSELTVAEI
jgi:hypothetical protein